MATIEHLFGIDAQLLFDAGLMALNMFLLFTALSYLLFNPAKNLLAKRQERITNEREQAASDRTEAEQLKSEYQEKLDGVQKEAEVILADARKRALKNEERIVEEAKEEAARIIAHAKNEAELEKKKAADDMKQEIIKVATLMAGKMVAAAMDEKSQAALLDETLREMGDNTWLS